MKQENWTAREHEEFGQNIKVARAIMQTLSVRFSNGYGTSDKLNAALDRILNDIESVRCELEKRYFNENKDNAREPSLSTYYGGLHDLTTYGLDGSVKQVTSDTLPHQ